MVMCYPEVSIIVPIYNAEKYIEKCSRSLFEQTFQSIEYIFVNDCSSDNSINVIKEILNDYPNRKEQCRHPPHICCQKDQLRCWR